MLPNTGHHGTSIHLLTNILSKALRSSEITKYFFQSINLASHMYFLENLFVLHAACRTLSKTLENKIFDFM